MRYDTAVRRLRTIAESCERPNRLTDTPILVAAYVFGDVLDAPAELPRTRWPSSSTFQQRRSHGSQSLRSAPAW